MGQVIVAFPTRTISIKRITHSIRSILDDRRPTSGSKPSLTYRRNHPSSRTQRIILPQPPQRILRNKGKKMGNFPVVDGVTVFMAAPEGYKVDLNRPERRHVLESYIICGFGLVLAFLFLIQFRYVKLSLLPRPDGEVGMDNPSKIHLRCGDVDMVSSLLGRGLDVFRSCSGCSDQYVVLIMMPFRLRPDDLGDDVN